MWVAVASSYLNKMHLILSSFLSIQKSQTTGGESFRYVYKLLKLFFDIFTAINCKVKPIPKYT